MDDPSIKIPERTDMPNNEHEVWPAPIKQLWLQHGHC